MILKHKDDVAPMVADLEQLLASPSLTKAQRQDLEEELWKIRAGAAGEKEAAYHIDFHWKDGRNSVVLHDLRIEHEGRVAQVDHLILMRTLACHVIESKGFGSEIRISEEGEWETKTRYGWRGIPSPLEQNHRHIEVLSAFIRDHNLAPKRLGISLPITFHNWVLVSPSCQIRRKGPEWYRVVKMDMFRQNFVKQLDETGVIDTLASISKFVSLETLKDFGNSLLVAHKPATFNFAARFAIPPQPPALPTLEPVCECCGIHLEAKVINFCRQNSKRFKSKLLCLMCQKPATKPGCDECGAELDQKVIAFCRFNSKRFGGRKLCRGCQLVS